MIIQMQYMRLEAIGNLIKANAFVKISIPLIKDKLCFWSDTDADNFVKACGYYYEQDMARGGVWQSKRVEVGVWRESFTKWKQSGPF